MVDKRLRLTKDSQNKVIKIEIYIDNQERCEFFKYFPDKSIEWKEAAPHLLLLKGLAGYEKKKLTTATENAETEKNKKVDALAALVKDLCHKTAPLYALINHPYLEDPFHPARAQWETFLKENPHLKNLNKTQLKIAFVKNELEKYNTAIKNLIGNSSQEGIQKFYQSHQEETKKFITQLDSLANKALDEDQFRKLLSNQDEANVLGINSLGQFLRSQAHELAGDALSALYDATDARFDQLFSFSAHPLGKELARAKKAIGDQESTHAARFLNTRSPIPPGQLAILEAVLENDDSGSKSEPESESKSKSKSESESESESKSDPESEPEPESEPKLKSEKKWFDIMDYVNCKTFLGNGIEGAEGLDDVDQILAWYANGGPQQIEKPYFRFYQWLMGKEGAVGILGVIFFGLPALIMIGAGLVVGACLAMAIDFLACLLQAVVFVFCSPVLLFGIIADFVLQIPGFFIEEAEIPFSFLARMVDWNIPPKALNRALRDISVVRIFKQFLLEARRNYKFVEEGIKPSLFSWGEQQEGEQISCTVNDASKDEVLERVRENQAEGLFNVAASRWFAFSNVAGFLHEKLKQFFYAARELRKVLGMLGESVYHLGEAGRVQEQQRRNVIDQLKQQIGLKNADLIKKFSDEFSKEFPEEFPKEFPDELSKEQENYFNINISSPTAIEKNIAAYQGREWPRIAPWSSRQINSPLDFISDIAAVAVGTVDFAFTEDPGIATPMFVLAMLGFGALLVPSVASVISAQAVNTVQWFPQYVAHAFMGKSLKTGLSDIVVNILSNFLQWQLTTYAVKGSIEVCHGNFDWVRKLFEYPEEITLGAGTFISIGYGMGFIPNLPTGVIPTSSHPFLNALAIYSGTLYDGFASAFNAVINESREVAANGASGLNTLELAFIGLKSSLLICSLFSGGHEAKITPLKVDFKKLFQDVDFKTLVRDYRDAGEERLAMIQKLLYEHGIKDPDSTLAKKIQDQFSKLADASEFSHESVVASRTRSNPEKKLSTATGLPRASCARNDGDGDSKDPKQNFIDKHRKLSELLSLVRDMEVLGMSIDLFDKNPQNIAYQSKKHAELVYDALFFAIEDYNQAARQTGLFHEQIDGRHFLHNFYNKHCYAGSSGWHKILFGILLFPVTWLWRGIKYLIGTPSMQHQVKKSFCKDLLAHGTASRIHFAQLRRIVGIFIRIIVARYPESSVITCKGELCQLIGNNKVIQLRLAREGVTKA